MSRGIVTARMEDFARSGALGPVRLGMSRQDIVRLVGRPKNWGINLPGMGKYKGWARSPIWIYGNAEIHFDENHLSLLHFDDGFRKPRGGQGLRVRSWVIREWMSLKALERALSKAHIEYKVSPDRWGNPGCVEVVTEGNVRFVVQVEGARRELGLRVFSCPAA